jgi:hypothetical protein
MEMKQTVQMLIPAMSARVRQIVMGVAVAMAALLTPPQLQAQDNFLGIHTVEVGRVQSVSVTPLSVTIDGRVFLVTEEFQLDGRKLTGDVTRIAAKLRTVAGKDAGYDWYQKPGQRPVVVSIVPVKNQ